MRELSSSSLNDNRLLCSFESLQEEVSAYVERFHTARGCSPENEKMKTFILHQLRDECILCSKVCIIINFLFR